MKSVREISGMQTINNLDTGLIGQRISERIIALGLLLVLLAGCASSPKTETQSASNPLPANYGRYSINQDRAPTQPLDPSLIREIIPVVETRTLAGNKSPYTVNGKSYRVMASEEGYNEVGLASWYGEKFHGHQTSNGEVFDMYQVSAAHKSLPIPSYATVTNLDNNRSIVVRVNDRGPFHNDRILDLSYAAAWKLGFSDRGTARVQVEALLPDLYNQGYPSTRVIAANVGGMGGAGKYLQIGAFSDLQSARQVTAKVQKMTSRPVFIRSVPADNARQILHRVRVGPLSDSAEIDRITALVVDADLGRPYTVED
jgi:rare lipoprotein A